MAIVAMELKVRGTDLGKMLGILTDNGVHDGRYEADGNCDIVRFKVSSGKQGDAIFDALYDAGVELLEF